MSELTIKVFTKPGCPFCQKAKDLLTARGLPYTEEDITQWEGDWAEKLKKKTGRQTVPQIYIGKTHVGGYDDLSAMVSTGELDRLLGNKVGSDQTVYDTIIIGGGPAGMAAAIYAARSKLSGLMLTVDIGGQMLLTGGFENYPGYQAVPATDLLKDFKDHVASYSFPILEGERVCNIGLNGSIKVITTQSGRTFFARTVIIASGRKPRLLGIPGEKRLIGKGITFCGLCDGPLFEGKPVLVIGGGNSGYEEALEMAKFASRVLLVTDKIFAQPILVDRVREHSLIEEHIGWKVNTFLGDSALEGAVLENIEDGEILSPDISGAFIKIGMEPSSAFALELMQTDKSGAIITNCGLDTGVPGIFAAGDVVADGVAQIVVATADGAKAAIKASQYLASQR